MRTLTGLILGVVLTIGGAYLHDSRMALRADSADAAREQPMVNWDVVGTKWGVLTSEARQQWDRLSARARDEWNSRG